MLQAKSQSVGNTRYRYCLQGNRKYTAPIYTYSYPDRSGQRKSFKYESIRSGARSPFLGEAFSRSGTRCPQSPTGLANLSHPRALSIPTHRFSAHVHKNRKASLEHVRGTKKQCRNVTLTRSNTSYLQTLVIPQHESPRIGHEQPAQHVVGA